MVDKNIPKHPLRVILDIPTLKDKYSEIIQRYEDNDFFEFIAIGSSSKFPELKVDLENNGLRLEKVRHNRTLGEEHHFPYTEERIKTLAERWDLKVEEVQLFYIIRKFASSRDSKTILVTERKKLINYKKYVSDQLPDFTIFCPEEAKIFIDLFCKRHGAYFVRPHFSVNKGLWYFYSMRAKFQQFPLALAVTVYSQNLSVDQDKKQKTMGSLSTRLIDMLKAIDEIGMNYYKGPNNDTMDDMLYHLNYWIALYSGILDALAWISLYRYGIPALNKNKVALGSEDVLNALYVRNSRLKEVINKNQKIIALVYEPRNIFIHREMLQGLGLEDYQAGLHLNMIDVEGEFLARIRSLRPTVEGNLNKAGLYKVKDHDRYFLEPYRFVKFATRELIGLLNQYVSALDYRELLSQDQVLEQKVEEAIRTIPHNLGFSDISEFEDFALGY